MAHRQISGAMAGGVAITTMSTSSRSTACCQLVVASAAKESASSAARACSGSATTSSRVRALSPTAAARRPPKAPAPASATPKMSFRRFTLTPASRLTRIRQSLGSLPRVVVFLARPAQPRLPERQLDKHKIKWEIEKLGTQPSRRKSPSGERKQIETKLRDGRRAEKQARLRQRRRTHERRKHRRGDQH